MTYTRPPFRADHVGSLLRPQELLRAREQLGKVANCPLLRCGKSKIVAFAMSSRCKRISAFRASPTVSIAEQSGTRIFCGRSTELQSRKGSLRPVGSHRRFQSGEQRNRPFAHQI